jgi:RPA family protein
MASLRAVEAPTYVAIVGRLRTYGPGDRVNFVIMPESITDANELTREAWVAEAAAQTSGRIKAFEAEEAPFGIQAQDKYGGNLSELREAVVAIEADDRE